MGYMFLWRCCIIVFPGNKNKQLAVWLESSFFIDHFSFLCLCFIPWIINSWSDLIDICFIRSEDYLFAASIILAPLVSIVIQVMEVGSPVLGFRGNHHSAPVYRRVKTMMAKHPTVQHYLRKLTGCRCKASLEHRDV